MKLLSPIGLGISAFAALLTFFAFLTG